jgi:5-methylcytosine-specific restriction endonuclease McrA
MKTSDRTLRSNRQRYQIYRSQNGLCGICHEPLGAEFEIDHKYPVTKGGQTEYQNLQATHRRCNRRKGSRP